MNDKTVDDPGTRERMVEAVLSSFLLHHPFYGHLVARIARRITPDVPTLAVSCTGSIPVLHINPDYFLSPEHSTEVRFGLLKHELLHLVLRHPERVPPQPGAAWNVACDVVVNELIGPNSLPAGALFGSHFKVFVDDMSAEEVFSVIKDGPITDTDQDVEGHQFWVSNSTGPTLGNGKNEEAIERAIERALMESWKRTSACSSPLEVPSVVRNMLRNMEERPHPSVDWRRALRLFASSCINTQLKGTNNRRSRRFGTFPGVKVQVRMRIAVVVDTSGSIDDHALETFFDEIAAINRNAEVTVIECDMKIQRVYPYTGEMPANVHGRGGTRYRPVFEWLNNMRGRFDGLVYFTDGLSMDDLSPAERPYCRIMWVLGGDYAKADRSSLLFGPIIEMK
jgi:predicted metal-dependent peptidase